MKKSVRATLAMLMSMSILLTGCNKNTGQLRTDDGDEIEEVNVNIGSADFKDVQALSFEEIASNAVVRKYNEVDKVFDYVNDNLMVDMSELVRLDSVNDKKEIDSIVDLITQINHGLAYGECPKGIDENFMNYMLLKFSNTPYTWEMATSANTDNENDVNLTSEDKERIEKEKSAQETAINIDGITIYGMDAQTRMYFVDVTYKTTDRTKEIIPDSLIVRGSEDEEKLKKARFSDYMMWLESTKKYNEGGTWKDTPWCRYIEQQTRDIEAFSALIEARKRKAIMRGYEQDVLDANNVESIEDLATDEEINKEIVNDLYNKATLTYTTDDGYTYKMPSFWDKWGAEQDIFDTQGNITLLERAARFGVGDSVIKENANADIDGLFTAGGSTSASTTPAETSGEGDDLFGDLFAEESDTSSNTNAVTRADATMKRGDIGVTTYTGLTEVAADHGATMTFRFTLKDTYSLGLDTSMTVQSMYLYNYKMDDSQGLLSQYTTPEIENADVLSPHIERVLTSYRKAIPEWNHKGLYSLFVSYGKYDTFIEDFCSYAYNSSGKYNFNIIGRKGSEFAIELNSRNKERAKGTYMTMPEYDERWLIKVKLCDDDVLRIVSTTLMRSVLRSEPLSVIKNVSGISNKITYNSGDFSVANQKAVESALLEFSKAQLEYNDATKDVWNAVDISTSESNKSEIFELFNATANFGATKSTVWLISYESKSNMYVTVKLRELFEGGESAWDTESTVSLFCRNDAWKVISYDRTLAVKSIKSNNSHANALVEIDLSKATTEEKYQLHSQVDKAAGVSGSTTTSEGSVGGTITIDNSDGFDDVAYTATTPAETEPVETDTNVDVGGETTEQMTETTLGDDPLAGLY